MDLAREAFLAGDWNRAHNLLIRQSDDGLLPSPLEARRLFWLGLSQQQLGEAAEAERTWRRLIESFPAGYYRWRAMDRLGIAEPLDLRNQLPEKDPPAWHPLNSQNTLVNTLWRLGQVHAAWEVWQAQRDPLTTPPPTQRLAEGRLRLAVGDTWMGLDQLWWLSLRWRDPNCQQQLLLTQPIPRHLQTESQQPLNETSKLNAARDRQTESRFAPGSSPRWSRWRDATALHGQEMAGAHQQPDAEGSRNIQLGARYLNQLLEQWNNDPFRSIASYNAGPGAVASWPQPMDGEEAALWVERIPYPETRFYTKKVLDNLLGYSGADQVFCDEAGRGVRQKRANDDATNHDNAHQKQASRSRGQNTNADEIEPRQQQG